MDLKRTARVDVMNVLICLYDEGVIKHVMTAVGVDNYEADCDAFVELAEYTLQDDPLPKGSFGKLRHLGYNDREIKKALADLKSQVDLLIEYAMSPYNKKKRTDVVLFAEKIQLK
jgi:hypothetical protein